MSEEDLKTELLAIGLEEDIRREMLSFLSKPSEFYPRREGVGLVFSFWRDRHPDLLVDVTNDKDRLDDIWQKCLRNQETFDAEEKENPITSRYLCLDPVIPCDGIDVLLRLSPVISRGLFRSEGDPFGQRGGIEFSGTGWLLILEEVFGWLELEAVKRKDAGFPDDHIPRLLQVKEKFGTLSVYASVPASIWPEWRERRMQAAEERSSRTCMSCGAAGTLRRDGWVRTHCNACEDAYRAEKGVS